MLLPRSTGPIRGKVTPPPSKSITHRALVAAALSPGTTVIENPLEAEDTRLTAAALTALGASVTYAGGAWTVTGPVARSDVGSDPVTLDLGNSGTSLRLLLPVAALLGRPVILDGSARLRQRPLGSQVAALRALGARVTELGAPGCPPVRVCGPLRGGEVEVDAGASSQIVSGLLLAGTGLSSPLMVRATALSSRPYVDLTVAVMEEFGYRVEGLGNAAWKIGPAAQGGAGKHAGPDCPDPFHYRVEADASAAAFLLAVGVVTGGRVQVEGVGTASRQGDVAFVDFLARMGCEVEATSSTLAATGKPTAGLTADLNATPDLVPPLAAVALLAPTPSRLTGIGHLRVKESDRLAALASEFTRLGGDVRAEENELLITPAPLAGGKVAAHGDHRIAMALAIAALTVPGESPGLSGVDLDDPDCIGKSYPGFFRDLAMLLQADLL